MTDSHHGQAHITPRNETVKNIWLYNIRRDPSETNDLVDIRPGKMFELLRLLAKYDEGSVPTIEWEEDENHTADDTGGAWMPWG